MPSLFFWKKTGRWSNEEKRHPVSNGSASWAMGGHDDEGFFPDSQLQNRKM